jgi:hypothetical protein
MAPDNVFSVIRGGSYVLVDECACMAHVRIPMELKPDDVCECMHCRHKGKVRSFAVKHTNQPGEKFAKDELEFLNEPCKGMATQPEGMAKTNRNDK